MTPGKVRERACLFSSCGAHHGHLPRCSRTYCPLVAATCSAAPPLLGKQKILLYFSGLLSKRALKAFPHETHAILELKGTLVQPPFFFFLAFFLKRRNPRIREVLSLGQGRIPVREVAWNGTPILIGRQGRKRELPFEA